MDFALFRPAQLILFNVYYVITLAHAVINI